ncbi:MAG: hypothetical protein K8S16_20760, partial [Bacteroidales bacterium]|nr:hypothetical protein [Bacteroidales bacterium]
AANIFENTGIRTDIRKVHYLCSGTMDGMKQINNPGFFTIDTLIFEGGIDPETMQLIPCVFRAYESDVHYSQVKLAPGDYVQNGSFFHRADFDGAESRFRGYNSVCDSLMFNNARGTLGGKHTITNLLFYGYIGTIAAAKLEYNDVNRAVFSDEGFFLGNNNIDSVIFSTGHWYQMQADSLFHPGSTHTNAYIQSIGYIEVTGECGVGLSILSSDHKGTQAVMNYTGGDYSADYLQIKDMFNQGDMFTINHGIDAGNNNDKFVITEDGARDLYWVGGKGYWKEIQHWSLSDGGPGGECPPTIRDNIYFTGNSGFITPIPDVIPPDTVNATNKHVWFNDMVWSDDITNPVLYGDGDDFMHCWGSFKFSTNMENWYFGTHYFESEDTLNWKTLDFTHSGGEYYVLNTTHFEGLDGKWRLETDFYAPGDTVFLTAGHLEMTNKTLGANMFLAEDTLTKGLYLLDKTHVEVYAKDTYAWIFRAYKANSEDPSTFFESEKSTIYMLGTNPPPPPGAPFGPCHFRTWGDTIIYNNIQFHTPEQLIFPGAVNSIMQSYGRNGFYRVDYYCKKGQSVGAGYIDTLIYKYLPEFDVGADSSMLTSNMYDVNVVLAEANAVTVAGNHSIDTLWFFQHGQLEGGNQIRKYMEAQQFARIKLLNTVEE